MENLTTNSSDAKNELKQIINYNPIATFFLDKEGTVVAWNKSCEILTGVSANEMVGKKDVWRPFYESERPVLANIILRGISDEEMNKFYKGMYTKSSILPGGYEVVSYINKIQKWIIFSASPIMNDSKEIIGAVETIQDITDLKKQEDLFDKYAETEKLNRLMIDRELKMIELKKKIENCKDINQVSNRSV